MKIVQITTDARAHYRQYDRPEPYFGTAPQALLEGFAADRNVEVHVVSCSQVPMRAPARIASNIYYHLLLVPPFGWLRTGYQGCVRAVRRKISELQPDIVHGQGTERDCAISAVFSGKPNVLTVHGNMRLIARLNGARPFSFEWLAARLESFTLPRTDGVVCITRYTQQAVSGLARRTWLLPNAVDGSFFAVAAKPEMPPVVLCVGLISRRKNQNSLIQALDEVAARHPLRMVFLGHVPDDPFGREFRELVGARRWCEYAGFAERGTLREWLARASALALPSLEDNCPMAVLEAMATGVPVMAANVGGVPDLVEDGVTGVLCDPLDPTSMARGIETLLTDLSLAAKAVDNGRRQARARFHPRAVAQRHVEVYEEILRTRA